MGDWVAGGFGCSDPYGCQGASSCAYDEYDCGSTYQVCCNHVWSDGWPCAANEVCITDLTVWSTPGNAGTLADAALLSRMTNLGIDLNGQNYVYDDQTYINNECYRYSFGTEKGADADPQAQNTWYDDRPIGS